MTVRLVDTPVLDTERLTLRAPMASDFDALVPFVMSDRARHVGGSTEHDISDAWRVLALLTGHWVLRGTGVFVCVAKATGKAIGSMGPWYPEGWPEQELSWTVWDPASEGQGFAHEAMIRIRRHVYDDLGWGGAVSYIAPDNTRSIALAERLDCTLDPQATGLDEDTLVYRHPAPAAVLT